MPNFNKSNVNFRKISVFIFDLDNTLIPTREADRKTAIECAKWLEKHGLSSEDSKDIASRFNSKFRKDPCPEFVSCIEELNKWRKDLWKSVLPSNFKNIDCLYLFWKEERQKRLMLSIPIQNMLKKVKKRYEIAILTNGPSVAQWEKLDNLYGIRRYCDTFVVSGDFTVEKPNREIYELLCNKLKVSPSECVMIGDQLDTDIVGAQNAGFGATVFVNYRNCKMDEYSTSMPDFVIDNVADLEHLLL